MENAIRRLGDAELEIMQSIWAAAGAVNSAYIQAALTGKRDWALATLLTTLSRLCAKGFLACEKQGKHNYYTALIPREAYQENEGRTMLEKLYGNSVTGLVTALYNGKSIGDRDLAELRRFLDEWGDEK